MINKIKSISKRTLALLLTLLMLISSGIIGAVAVNVDFAETGAYKELAETGATITSDGTARLYFNKEAISWWDDAGCGMFGYFFDNSAGKNAWSANAKQYSGDTYYVNIPSGSWPNVVLTRNGSTTSPSWDNKHNQTGDITLSSTSNYISKFSENSGSVTWGTAIKPSSTASLAANSASVFTEESVTLTPSLSSNANINTIKSTTYSINPSTGASVSGNTFTATAAGTYTVTATVTYHPNGYSNLTSTATATTTIEVKQSSFSYTVSASEGGTVSPAEGTYTVTPGEAVTLKAEADEAHDFAGWEITGGNYTTDDDIDNDAEITIYPTGSLNVKAKFADKTNEVVVSVKPSEGGTIANPGTHTIKYNGSIDLEVTKVNDHYDFDGWYVNNVLFSEELQCTLTDIIEKKVVEARFTEHDKFVVTVTQSGGEGRVTADGYLVEDNITVYVNETVEFYVEAPENHYISNINGTTNNDDTLNEFQFNVGPIIDVTEVTIGYTELDKFQVTVTNDNTKGTLDVASKEVYKYSDLTITATPASKRFKVTDWKVNGELTGVSGNTYTLTNVNAITTVEPVWTEVLGYTVTVQVNDPAMGKASANEYLVLPGENVTVNATANDLYGFVGWTINDIQVNENEEYTFAVTDDVTIVANFKQTHKYYYYENSGDKAHAYAWYKENDTNKENGAWPGQEMEKYAEGIFRIKLELIYENVIFSNGGNSKTDDLTLPSATDEENCFTDNEWKYLDINTIPVVVYGDSGTSTSSDAPLGLTTFKELIEDTLKVEYENKKNETQEANNWYTKVKVNANTLVEIRTKLQDLGKDYYVEGWVINGTEFKEATLTGAGDEEAYTATYMFTEPVNTVVPIYFHTETWRNNNGVELVELVAKMDTTQENWNQYMSAYAWYDNYESFGQWPGQLMIPVNGVDDAYYTYVEKTGGANKPIQGITFSNYGGHSDTTRLPVGKEYPVTNYYNLQVYDYYEFIELVNQGQKNITFELKTHNSKMNYGTTNFNLNTTYSLDSYNFTDYVDSAGIAMDIFREDVTTEDVGLYIVRSAPTAKVNDGNAVGNFYVTCHLFDSNKKYLGSCISYKLLKLIKGTDYADLSTTIENYVNSISGKKVMVSYETKTVYGVNNNSVIGSNNDAQHYAPRLDGEWYADSEATVYVDVAITEDGGITYTPDLEGISGSASITWKEQTGTSLTVDIGDDIKLDAFKNNEYKFIGWYDAKGNQFSNVASTTVPVAYGTTYTAVFQKLGHYEFNITHSYYPGDTTGNAPLALKGQGILYVGVSKDAFITDVTQLNSSITGSVSTDIEALEGDKLYITIATDANEPDKFVSWYVDSLTAAGVKTFEQVGMNSSSNKFNNTGEIKGSQNLVGFSFEYIVSKDKGLNLYSDIEEVSSYKDLIYMYEDRYKKDKTYIVPDVKLSDEEILNDYTPKESTILAHAPYVDDLYTDAVWQILDNYYDGTILWAIQTKPTYTVTVNAGNGNIKTYTGMFNAEGTTTEDGETVVLELDARSINPSATNNGYWEDQNGIILAYGRYYSLRVTRNMTLKYVQSETPLDFDIVLDNPVYGREQYTDDTGEVKTDKVIIDYMTSIHVPLFRNDKTAGNKVITDVYYNDTIIDSTNSPVTIETLAEHYNYKFEHYIVVEQVRYDKDYVGNNGTPTADAELFEIIKNYKEPTLNTAGDKYYVVYNTSEYTLTNKNRFLFTTYLYNNSVNVKNNYNVYGCLKVTDDTNKEHYFVGDPQTLNIADAANKPPVVISNS